ncbi:MAG: RDD family protein [Verrucomicrobiales bacterium]|nr:RDD family protein [Verrucomicrobiales bacterium]
MAFHLARDQQTLGVFPDYQVREGLRSGEFLPTDLGWTEGMVEWKPLAELDLLDEDADEVQGDGPARARTPEAPLAELWQRLAASLLDSLPALTAFIALRLAVGLSWDPREPMPEELDMSRVNLPQMQGALLAMGMLTAVQLTLLWQRGQTIGKWLIGIRIVNLENDEVPSPKRIILIRTLLNGLFSVIVFYALADVLLIFATDRRCIHDYLASTRVVKGHPQR